MIDLSDKPWFSIPVDNPNEAGERAIKAVQDIERRQSGIHDGNLRHAKLYAGYVPPGMSWTSGAAGKVRRPFSATKAVVRSVCDTATALITRFRAKPTFVTDGASWEIQQQAEELDRFMVGAYARSGIYKTYTNSFRDTTIFGTGGWRIVPRGTGRDWFVAAERFNPDNLVVDEDECPENPEPENTYYRIAVSKDALIRQYAAADKDLAWKIRSAGGRSWPNQPSVPEDRVVLVEAIHVPLAGGRAMRWLGGDGFTLEYGEWPYPWHPYVILWWVPPITGFYGDGVAYRQFGLQERITYLYKWLERVHDLFGTPQAWVDPAGGPPVLQMTNEIGAVISARKKPEFAPRQMVSAEVYNWIETLVRGGFEDEGINQLSSAGRLPPGVDSAPAQREYVFKETNRFAPVSQRLEDAVAVETARKMLAMYRRRAETTEERPAVQWADRGLLHRIEWPDLDENAYQIRAEASSLEALSPAARLQGAIELAQTQWLRPGEGRRLVGHPDLKRSDDLDNAPVDYAEMVLSKLLHGEYVEVDDYADYQVLDSTIRRGRLLARTRNAPQHLIDNCSDYLDRLQTAIATATSAAQMGAMGAQDLVPSEPLTTGAQPGTPPSHQ